jgi:hypothetical protein
MVWVIVPWAMCEDYVGAERTHEADDGFTGFEGGLEAAVAVCEDGVGFDA